MCLYCMMADWMHYYAPYSPNTTPWPTTPASPWPSSPGQPWPPNPAQPLPSPLTPVLPGFPVDLPGLPFPPQNPGYPWSQKQLDDALEILAKIKELEDALGGCPCEDASKMDFLKEIQAKIDAAKG